MIRVLVVDDSLIVRKEITRILSQDPGIQVVGTATDPYMAREKIVSLKPDLMTLDIEMPRMDGLTFLGKVMKYYPLPILVISSITPVGSAAAVQALELGAVEVISKPASDAVLGRFGRELIAMVKAVANAHVPAVGTAEKTAAKPLELLPAKPGERLDQILAIGASTGGPDAVSRILKHLPANTPGTLIVQHMPEFIIPAFANRLNQVGAMRVSVAQSGQVVRPGTAFVAPDNCHLLIERRDNHYVTLLKDGPSVYHQKPSVEVLFQSVARHAGPRAVGVLLTGMGSDGATGLLAMRQAGAPTLAQDEASCVVYGMPTAAAESGAAAVVESLANMPGQILRAFLTMD